MSGIGVITNPKAKRNLNRPWIKDTLTRIVGDSGKVYETRSIDELPAVAEDFMKRDLDVLAVNGGDGTVHIVLTNFIPAYGDRPLPKLLSLRGGTMNTISNAIKHKGQSENILKSVVAKIRDGKPLDIVNQPILKINEKYGFLWGFGVVGNFMEQYYKGTNPGTWQAFKVVTRMVWSAIFRTQYAKDIFAPFPASIVLDGVPRDVGDCRVVVASTIKEFGLGFKFTYRAYEKPGYTHILAMSFSPAQIVPWMPHIFMGKRIPRDEVLDEIAGEIVVETEGNPPYVIDGELYRDTNVFKIRQGPVIEVIRAGLKKPVKGIGLEASAVKRALPEEG